MNAREKFITEIWKEESKAIGIRLIGLDEKQQDCGLTPEEEVEYAVLKEENSRLLMKMLHDLQGVRSA